VADALLDPAPVQQQVLLLLLHAMLAIA